MRTVTGLFDTYEDARRAVSDLETVGIPTHDISIVSHKGVDSDSFVAEGWGRGLAWARSLVGRAGYWPD